MSPQPPLNSTRLRGVRTALTSARKSPRQGLRPRLLRTIHRKFSSRAKLKHLLALVPGLAALVVTTFTSIITPYNPDVRPLLFWTPAEIGIWLLPLVFGVVWIGYAAAKSARTELARARKAEDMRRAVAAIGVAANWDLDLERLYRRVSQDLRSILHFDRLAVTAAQSDGRMKVEFVFGPGGEGVPAGEFLSGAPVEPDGLDQSALLSYRSRLTVPMAACSGTLTIRSKQGRAYTAEHADLLRQAVAQISPGVSNAIHYRSSRRQVQERTALAAIGRSANSEHELNAVFATVESALSKLISFDHLGVILTTEDSKTGVIAYWSSAGMLGRDQGEMVAIDLQGASDSVAVSSNGCDPLGLKAPGFEGEDDGRTWLQAPLVVHENVIGIIVLSTNHPGGITGEESALVQNVSLQVAPAIQNAVLTEHLKRRADERRAIAAIGLAANQELNVDAIYGRVADELAQVVPYDRMVILHSSPDASRCEVGFVRGEEERGQQVGDFVASPGEVSAPGAQGRSASSAQVPLGAGNQLIGFLSIHSSQQSVYDARTVDFLERVADQVAPAIRNARMLAAERELRSTLDRQNRELQEANNARKQFLSTVSHELKTPLTIISGFIDLLMSGKGAQSDPEEHETLEIIRRNANHLDILINDLLDISRIDSGSLKLNKAPFCVNRLVEDIEASFRSITVQKDQQLSVELPGEEVWINADRTRIAQLITNLISNASKYSPEGTEVEVRCSVQDRQLHVAVRDHGIGIPESEQKSLFTAFFRVDNETTRKVSGTGLGLVIAKSIVELHGGEIRLESAPGEGTMIEFRVPGLTSPREAEANTAKAVITESRLWQGREMADGYEDDDEEEMQLGAD